MPYIVNQYTSVVPVRTESLTAGQQEIVYLSTTQQVGQLITVRDINGHLSSTQGILLSTTGGATISTGLSTIKIQQRYGYVTLRASSQTQWRIVDENAFRDPSDDYTLRGVAYEDLIIEGPVTLQGSVSSLGMVTAPGMSLTSTLENRGPLFISTLAVNDYSRFQHITTDANNWIVAGSVLITSNLHLFSSISTVGAVTTSSAVIQGPLTISGNFSLEGGVIHSTPTGQLTIQSTISSSYGLRLQTSLSSVGTLITFGPTRVGNTLTASSIALHDATFTQLNTNSLALSNTTINRRTDITAVAPGYTSTTTPVAQIQGGTAATAVIAPWFTASSMTTRTLTVNGIISAPTASSIVFAAAEIRNTNGSAAISSIGVQTLTYNTLLGPAATTALSTVSCATAAFASGNIQFAVRTNVAAFPAFYATSFSTNRVTTSSLLLGTTELASSNLAISSIFISSGVNFNTLSSVNAPIALINNSGGQLITSSIRTNRAALSSVLLQVQTLTSATQSSFGFSTPLTVISTAHISTAIAIDVNTSSLRAVGVRLGTPLNYSTIGPSDLYLFSPNPSTNTQYEYVTGIGTVYDPLLIKASNDRSIDIYFGNISSFSTAYLNLQYTYTNNGSASGAASILTKNPSGQSTLVTFSANPIQTIQRTALSNLPIDRNFSTITSTILYLDGPLNLKPPSTTEGEHILAGGGNSNFYFSQNGGTSGTISPSIFTTETCEIIWARDKWIAVGEGGSTIAYSYTGSVWISGGANIFTTAGLGIAIGDDRFVATGEGTNTLAYSYDGITWIGLGSSIFSTGYGVAYNGFHWVAVGAGTNTIAYSYDGITWTGLGSSIFDANGFRVCWGADKWVATGYTNTTNYLAYSYDGITWTGLGNPFSADGFGLQYNGTLWVATSANSTYPIWYSSNGISWTGVSISGVSTGARSVAWTGSKWVGITASGMLITSSNGTTWTLGATILGGTGFTIAANFSFLDVAVRGAALLVGGGSTTGTTNTNVMSYSYDGVHWLSNTIGVVPGYMVKVVWNGKRFVAAVYANSTATSGCYYSDDGINWFAQTTAVFSAWCTDVAWNGYMWVGTGSADPTYVVAISYDGANWTGVSSPLDGVSTNGVGWGNNRWVIVGGTGTINIMYSDDGLNWVSAGNPLGWILGGQVAYNGTYWIAIGFIGSAGDHIGKSLDGITWTAATTQPFDIGGLSIATSGSRWVVTGLDIASDCMIAYSDDGDTWVGQSFPQGNTGYGSGVLWNGAKFYLAGNVADAPPVSSNFVAVGGGTNNIAFSNDGITWTTTVNGNTFFTNGLGVAWNGSYWIAVGYGPYRVIKSTDGLNWSSIPGADALMQEVGNGVAWGDDKWIVVGQGNPAGGIVSNPSAIYSYDGVNWFEITSLSNLLTYTTLRFAAYAIAYNGTMWVSNAESFSGLTSPFSYSYDGINWSRAATNPINQIYNYAWNGTLWVAVGQNSAGRPGVSYSSDGINWTDSIQATTVFTNGFGLIAVAWANGIFIATGANGGTVTAGYSYDGINWTALTAVSAGLSYGLSVSWNGSLFLLTGYPAVFYTSADGVNWTLTGNNGGSIITIQASGSSSQNLLPNTPQGQRSIVYSSTDGVTWSDGNPNLSGPAYGMGAKQLPLVMETQDVCIAVGASSTALAAISADGRAWSTLSIPFTSRCYAVAYNGNQWIAVGEGTYQVAYSVNGVEWTGVTLPNLTTCYCVCWGADATGSNPRWLIGGGTAAGYGYADSADGISWTEQTAIFTVATLGLFFANGTFFAVGGSSGGGFAYSTDGLSWTTAVTPLFTTARGLYFNGSTGVIVGDTTTYGNTLAYLDYTLINITPLGNTTFSTAAYDVTFGNGLWVAVGAGTNTIAVSADGVNWQGLGTSIFSTAGRGITWNGKRFVATGEGVNTLAESADGIHWTGLGTTTFSSATYLGNPGTGLQVRARRYVDTLRPDLQTYTYTWAAFTGSVVALGQDTIQKMNLGTAAWNSRAYTTTTFTDSAYLSFRAGTATREFAIGFSENPLSASDFSPLNFAFHLLTNGQVEIFELGSTIGSYGSYTPATIFKIIFNGSTVRYYKDSTLLRTVNRSVGTALAMSSSFYSPGAQAFNIRFHRLYTYKTSPPTANTSSFIVSATPGAPVSLADPIYYTLSSNLPAGTWSLGVAAGASNLSNLSTTLSADVYINETLYFSTNTISNAYLSTLSTYQLSFTVPSFISTATGDALNIRFKGTRSQGLSYIYGQWVNSNATQYTSTTAQTTFGSGNAIEYLTFNHSNANSGIQTSEVALWITATSTMTATDYTDSNAGLLMNRGFIRWTSSINAATIMNRYNDTTTRSLTYTNALYNASDPALKCEIELIDTEQAIVSLSKLPLHRYAFTSAYCSTFRLEDRRQLGVLTTEVEPALVHSAPFGYMGLSTVNTVDRAQLKFTHLAATQALISRISTLEGRIVEIVRGTR